MEKKANIMFCKILYNNKQKILGGKGKGAGKQILSFVKYLTTTSKKFF